LKSNTEQKNKPLPSGSGQLLRNCFFSSVSPKPQQTTSFKCGSKPKVLVILWMFYENHL